VDSTAARLGFKFELNSDGGRINNVGSRSRARLLYKILKCKWNTV